MIFLANCMLTLKIKNKQNIGCFFQIKLKRILDILWAGVFNEIIIPLALVGYEMIIANPWSYPTRTRKIIVK